MRKLSKDIIRLFTNETHRIYIGIHWIDRIYPFLLLRLMSQIEKTEWIRKRVQETIGPGIIYVSSRKRADELASDLKE